MAAETYMIGGEGLVLRSDLEALARRIVDTAANGAVRRLRDGIERIAARAVSIAPVKTGTYKASINVTTRFFPDSVVVRLSAVAYSRYIFGARAQGPDIPPTMRTARYVPISERRPGTRWQMDLRRPSLAGLQEVLDEMGDVIRAGASNG